MKLIINFWLTLGFFSICFVAQGQDFYMKAPKRTQAEIDSIEMACYNFVRTLPKYYRDSIKVFVMGPIFKTKSHKTIEDIRFDIPIAGNYYFVISALYEKEDQFPEAFAFCNFPKEGIFECINNLGNTTIEQSIEAGSRYFASDRYYVIVKQILEYAKQVLAEKMEECATAND